MSFSASARRVRDAGLPYGHRVAALRSCVERYAPIGFHRSLSFLEEIAGPFHSDEGALLRALDALTASRAARKVVAAEYAESRRGAKRRGERSPRLSAPNPYTMATWYGDVRRAALHVMRHEQEELGRLGAACGIGSVEARLSDLIDEAIRSDGHLSADQVLILADIMDTLAARLTRDVYRVDPRTYNHVRRLHRFGELIRAASSDG